MYHYTLNGTSLERVFEYVDLGVTVDLKLKFTKHVQKIVKIKLTGF